MGVTGDPRGPPGGLWRPLDYSDGLDGADDESPGGEGLIGWKGIHYSRLYNYCSLFNIVAVRSGPSLGKTRETTTLCDPFEKMHQQLSTCGHHPPFVAGSSVVRPSHCRPLHRCARDARRHRAHHVASPSQCSLAAVLSAQSSAQTHVHCAPLPVPVQHSYSH